MRGQALIGKLVREVLTRAGVNITEAAMALGISRVNLSTVLNGRAAVSMTLALRLEAVYKENATALLHRQLDVQLVEARAVARERRSA